MLLVRTMSTRIAEINWEMIVAVCNPLDGHTEAHYKKKVKADIHDTGETEEVQRPLRIANGTQDSTSHVVYKQTENAGKIDL